MYSIAQVVLVLNSGCVEVTLVPTNREVDDKLTVCACVTYVYMPEFVCIINATMKNDKLDYI